MKSLLLAFVLIMTLESCDCVITVKGRIYSNSSGLPIENASVEMIDKNERTTTDKNGYFTVTKVVGFCFDPVIRVTKQKYKPFEIKFKNSSDSKTYKIKSQLESYTYDRPFYPDSNNKNSFITGSWTNLYSENFAVHADTVCLYLDTIDLKGETQKAQNSFKKALSP